MPRDYNFSTDIMDIDSLEGPQKIYYNYLRRRNIKRLEFYTTPTLESLTNEEKAQIEVEGHYWARGDRYYKIALEYYSDASYWWVIAWFNRRPTEGHIKIGDYIEIPINLQDILEYT